MNLVDSETVLEYHLKMLCCVCYRVQCILLLRLFYHVKLKLGQPVLVVKKIIVGLTNKISSLTWLP